MPFNFPDPAVTTTVTNPLTGATYQWKADPGKWVLAGGAPPAPDTYFPFTSSYTLVHPDNYTEADGTCTIETDAYVNDPDTNFNSPFITKWRFAAYDLNGQPLTNSSGNIKYFDYTQYPRHANTGGDIQYATFETTARVGYQDWEGNIAFSRYLNLTEDAEVHIRYPSQADEINDYVKKEGGDTMEGQLIINGPRKAGDDVDNPKLVSSLKVLSIDNAQNSSLQLRHSGNAKVYVGDTDISVASDIKFNRAAGSVVRTNVQDILNIGSEEIAYLGRSIEDEDLITKKYVDDTKDFLQNEIIELEEEIEAIAPSTERGTWAYNPVGNVSIPGSYTMYTDTRDNGLGNVASIFAAVKNIALNEKDLSNVVHNFGGTDQGDLIEIFEEGDADYGLYSIISIEKITNPNPGGISYTYVSIDVDLERTGNGHTADSRARFKVFKAPTGGDASGFVLKTGDTMTGNLDIDKSEASTNIEAGLKLKGSRGNTTNAAATITFQNAQSVDLGYLTYRSYDSSSYFRFNQDVDLNNNGLHSVAQIRMQPGGYIGSGSNQRVKVRGGGGSDGQAGTEIQRIGDVKRTFAIKGKAAGSSSVTDFFWAYGNSGTGGDAINYTGRMTSDTNIVTKAYVDSKLPTYTITKSGGNYYVS